MSLGPLMLDLRGPELEQDEKEILRHPLVGGVILFSRNYRNPGQLRELTGRIHKLRQPPMLIAVDHEGGRVQRFRDGFTHLPPCRSIGQAFDRDAAEGAALAERAGWLMAMELLACGVDFSFAPVLDLDLGLSGVIGDRAFHRDPEIVTLLGRAFIQGVKAAGMAPVGKHFPGHGGVTEDSHHAVPVDGRRFEDILMLDLVPFERLIKSGLAGIMPAHVIYSRVDDRPAGFSGKWLQGVLRERLGFNGVIFSDDISMAGAGVAGDYRKRALAALAAGCDMVVICNRQEEAIRLLDRLDTEADPLAQVRMMRMHGRDPDMDLAKLKHESDWQTAASAVLAVDKMPELDLGDDEIQT